ncbi:MAG TPA: hypothetical protein VFM35_03400 [Candidatus Binatia bacterium]|nr:hypothetical protein [Candidatus Binatia bacterium]
MKQITSAIAVLLTVIILPQVSWADNHWKSLMPDGEGKEVTIQLCGTMCHNIQKTVVSKKSPAEWERTVYDMIRRGAQIFPDEAEQIIKYLSKNFPAGQAQAR